MAGRETVGEAWVKIHADGTGFDEEVRRDIDKAEPTFEKGGEEHGKAYIRGLRKTDRDRKGFFANLKADLATTFRDAEKVGSRVGKIFGKGSRNDFLNIIGGMVGGLATLTVAIGKMIVGPFAALFKSFGQVRDAGAGVGEALGASLSQGAVGIAVAVAAVVAAGEALTAAMGAIGSGVVLLSGLILALAGSIGFALVGALVAAAGALVPFAAAFGVFALALTSPNIGKQLKSLKDDLSDLSELAAQNIFGKHGEGVRALGNVLSAVRPVVDAVSSALGGLVQWLGEAARSKGFTDMMNNIARAIGPMITQIGKIGGNLATFLGEAFLAAQPMINEFLGWLEGITKKMADFGKGGKNSGLAKFFQDAWASAKVVGGLIWEIIGLVGDLLSGGRQTGDNIFTKITDWVKKIRDWLADPANQKTLQQWWHDAEILGDKLGTVVDNVGKFIDKLDTPENRSIFLTLIDAVNLLLTALTGVASATDDFNKKSAEGLQGPGERIKSLFTELPSQIGSALSGLWGTVSSALAPVVAGIANFFAPIPGQIAGFFTGLGSKIVTAAGDLWSSFSTWFMGVINAIPGIISQITGFFVGLPGKIWAAAGDIASSFGTWLAGLPAQVITTIGQLIIGFNNLAGKMITAAGNIIGAFTQWLADLPGKALQAAVNITVAFINLSIKMINAAGNLATQFAGWVQSLPGKASKLATDIWHGMVGLAVKMIQGAGNLASAFARWVQSLPGKARSLAIQIINAMGNLAGKMISRAGDLAGRFAGWVRSLPGKARQIASDIATAFSGLAGKMIQKAGDIAAKLRSWASGVGAAADRVASDIVSSFSGLARRIVDAIGTIVPHFRLPTINVPKINLGASGFIADGPTLSVIGEAGPEAVVPLARPLQAVDPAVRALSAIAQGRLQAKNEGVRTGRTIEVGQIQVITPTEDPRAVASEVVARMAAAAYL